MIRKASIKDVKSIYKLLKIYGDKGELLPRPLSRLYDHLRDFWVYEHQDGDIIGCCALQFCWEDLAEVRSLAVHPDHTKKGVGTDLVMVSMDDAKTYDISEVFALTYRPGFFAHLGFSRIDLAELPLKVWSDCIPCVKFPDCDEIAMSIKIRPDRLFHSTRQDVNVFKIKER